MAGKVKTLIEELIQLRTEGRPSLAPFVRAQLMMKGIHPDSFTEHSEDDPDKVAQLEAMLRDFGNDGA